MSQDKESLSTLTLRQLRQKASSVGVPLYSRKTKASLIDEIITYANKKDLEAKVAVRDSKKDNFLANVLNSTSNAAQYNSLTKVVFLPRDPEWAFVFWEISEEDRNQALDRGATRLSLRLLDVTGKESGDVNKGALREVTVDSHSTEWYLPIPLGDRDYQVELGYRFRGKWISLAFSSSAKVPSQHPSELILDQFVPFSLETPKNIPLESLVVEEPADQGLHQRLYQSATDTFRKTRVGSEEFQEKNAINSDNQGLSDSGAGLWASGRNESGIGLSSNDQSFWLVADAELIVYGATDPSAKLTIGGENVPLDSDGTFRLQVPFRDGIQNYPIQAIDSKGQEKRNITMKFERVTPEDNTNPRDKAAPEWF